ncbi:unnamed protein product [Merluccius merluccius]
MDMVLHWDQPGNTSQVSYTTEINSPVTVYRPGCVNISVLSCDFTALDIPLTAYGTYRGRVRAQRGPETTAWVESGSLTLDINTTIGPPNVTLVSNGVHVTIHIIDPVFRISNLRDIYNYASYIVTYWRENEEGKKDKAKNMTVQQNPLVLSDLEPLSRYCVKVQIKTVRNITPSRESRVTCMKTTDQERLPWLEAVVTFFVIAMGVAVAVVVIVYRKKLANFLCPRVLLPPYFKTNLGETPGSLIHVAMGNYCPPVETYDLVNVIPTENNTDEERHLVAEEDLCSARCQTEEEPKQTSCGKGALFMFKLPWFLGSGNVAPRGKLSIQAEGFTWTRAGRE